MSGYHNVGLGMVPHRKGCRCEECTIERLEAKVRTMQARIDALAAAAGIVVRHLQWHEDGSHYVNVDVDNMRALSALLEASYDVSNT